MSNLEEQISQELAEQMCSSIDFEILSDVLVNACGWHKIKLTRFTDNRHAVDIANWCHDTLKNEWKRNGSTFIFEDQGDAVNFTLKWWR
jgi:hypothetical protein